MAGSCCPPRCSGCRRSRGTRWSGLFGGEALAVLLGIPFWVAVLIVLGVQGAVGFFGYEVIHRLQAVLTVVLFMTFVVFAVKLVGGHEIVTHRRVSGRRPCRRVRARGDDRVQPRGVVGQLRRRLQPLPACRLVAGAGVRVHVRRNRVGVHLRSGHRHRGGRCGVRAHRRGRPVGDGRRVAGRAGAARSSRWRRSVRA